uniref:ATP synthase F0 subunit 8 n=1 Tax=Trapezia rufopunctata TaxID=399052 RepID=UPI0028D02DB0|nr:ATP synthase F0 subunit 8 [Trapezia rufopunctata]WMQ53223.1 ATP synthase F0 subunit 8 [Trapezia rufopunctata]
MPQMAPLLWLSLFGFFLLSFIIMLTMVFFIKPYEIMLTSFPSAHTLQKSWKL